MNSKDVINKTINVAKKTSISFVIPFYGEYAKVLDLIENINKIFYHLEKDIILIDDCSPNKEFVNILKKPNKYTVVRHSENKGFGASVNTGLKLCQSKYACILHTDVKFYDKNCISNLLSEIQKLESQSVILISSVSNNPLVHEKELKRTEATSDPAYVTKLSHLPLYCAMVNVRGILMCQGLPEFPLVWFEDEGLGYKIKKNRFNFAVCPSSYVYHEGMGTIKNLVNYKPNCISIMKNNISFLKKLKSDNTYT